jgi:predicted nucleotidyltransferase
MYQKRNKELDIIALFFGDYKKQFYLREISKLTKIPLKTNQTLTAHLEKDKILKSMIIGKNKYFRLNLDNIQTKLCLLKSELHKTSVFVERYPLFKIFIKEISTNLPIIVFGSFARFKADKDSDLDLMIISKEKQKMPFHLLAYKKHEINLDEGSFIKALEKQETLIKEIQESHIILNNHSFFVNAMWDYYGKH